MLYTSVDEFVELARQNGGGSHQPLTHVTNPVEGFMVGLKLPEDMASALPWPSNQWTRTTLTPGDYFTFFNKTLPSFLANPTRSLYLGVWFHEGLWYYDLVKQVFVYHRAMKLGRENYQLAIWDCANQREIPVRRS